MINIYIRNILNLHKKIYNLRIKILVAIPFELNNLIFLWDQRSILLTSSRKNEIQTTIIYKKNLLQMIIIIYKIECLPSLWTAYITVDPLPIPMILLFCKMVVRKI